MKSLLRIFLYELGGNPNKKNARDETSLHCVCMALNGRNIAIQQRRLECLSLILQWRGATLKDGEVEKADLGAQDEKLNTGLHYAAASGLRRCVELLVNANGPLFLENALKQTPCDCSEKNDHSDIALYLESKMVFSAESGEEENEATLHLIDNQEDYSGLRAQDLQEAKDQLLVETSDMLQVPLFTAEALLRNHEWSRETLLESWMDDPIACCDKCGVVPPRSICDEAPSSADALPLVAPPTPVLETELLEETECIEAGSPPAIELVPTEQECDICTGLILPNEDAVPMSCDHLFCRGCWSRYLTGKIQEGDAHNITCPGFDCGILVPVEVIETLVSRDMARRYLQFDIKAFVESNPNIKWCPSPGCGRAVKLPDPEGATSPTIRASANQDQTNDTSRAVDCGNGHYFCWECLGEAHEPASCDNWRKWSQKIVECKPEEMNDTEEETEIAANCLWLVTNSKPCPSCKSPIQKNEGCNHMKCSKCKYDFCWVCLEPWKKHSSATGGYFRCNRYEVVKKVEEGTDSMKAEAEEKHRRMQELNKFVHYYTRFKNHENSYKLEEPLVSTAKEKMMILARAMTDPENASVETKFVEDAVNQLLKARRVLKCSYVYGYYLEDTGYKKPIFEFMQTELEECTETLSQMIARPYLRTPRAKIIQTAHLVQRKRHEFVSAIAKGLVPPDTSPNWRKRRKKFSVELDEDLRKALIASLQDLDPNNPWIKDSSGRHTNIHALLDWPEDEDSDNETPATTTASGGATETSVDICSREGCTCPKAKNPRTGDLHNHCSMKCMRLDQAEKTTQKEVEVSSASGDFVTDYQMDLLRALEMSRLQFVREMGSLGLPETAENPSVNEGASAAAASVTDPAAVVGGGSLVSESSRNNSFCKLSPTPNKPPFTTSSSSSSAKTSPNRLGRTSPNPPRGNKEGLVIENLALDQLEDFDPEFQRAIELSRISAEGEVIVEDADLKLAIELSLKDTPETDKSTSVHRSAHPSTSSQSQSSTLPSPFDPDYTSIVNRVPNKSVEDLSNEGCCPRSPYEDETFELLGAHGGGAYLNRLDGARPRSRSNTFDDERKPLRRAGAQSVPVSPRAVDVELQTRQNTFGVIKDISAANIFTNDFDKTKEFDKKDFKNRKNPFDGAEPDSVFEPRPPRPVDSIDLLKREPEATVNKREKNTRSQSKSSSSDTSWTEFMQPRRRSGFREPRSPGTTVFFSGDIARHGHEGREIDRSEDPEKVISDLMAETESAEYLANDASRHLTGKDVARLLTGRGGTSSLGLLTDPVRPVDVTNFDHHCEDVWQPRVMPDVIQTAGLDTALANLSSLTNELTFSSENRRSRSYSDSKSNGSAASHQTDFPSSSSTIGGATEASSKNSEPNPDGDTEIQSPVRLHISEDEDDEDTSQDPVYV